MDGFAINARPMAPVQVTRDLASFWATGYKAVKSELKGRYPRHYWPDDPLVAEPMRDRDIFDLLGFD